MRPPGRPGERAGPQRPPAPGPASARGDRTTDRFFCAWEEGGKHCKKRQTHRKANPNSSMGLAGCSNKSYCVSALLAHLEAHRQLPPADHALCLLRLCRQRVPAICSLLLFMLRLLMGLDRPLWGPGRRRVRHDCFYQRRGQGALGGGAGRHCAQEAAADDVAWREGRRVCSGSRS